MHHLFLLPLNHYNWINCLEIQDIKKIYFKFCVLWSKYPMKKVLQGTESLASMESNVSQCLTCDRERPQWHVSFLINALVALHKSFTLLPKTLTINYYTLTIHPLKPIRGQNPCELQWQENTFSGYVMVIFVPREHRETVSSAVSFHWAVIMERQWTELDGYHCWQSTGDRLSEV